MGPVDTWRAAKGHQAPVAASCQVELEGAAKSYGELPESCQGELGGAVQGCRDLPGLDRRQGMPATGCSQVWFQAARHMELAASCQEELREAAKSCGKLPELGSRQ